MSVEQVTHYLFVFLFFFFFFFYFILIYLWALEAPFTIPLPFGPIDCMLSIAEKRRVPSRVEWARGSPKRLASLGRSESVIFAPRLRVPPNHAEASSAKFSSRKLCSATPGRLRDAMHAAAKNSPLMLLAPLLIVLVYFADTGQSVTLLSADPFKYILQPDQNEIYSMQKQTGK